ncbi:hypothetical protein C8Q79DRAFT_1010188 [Trametes meyenii]|nr:hypothetical protein C8Q79DRAFT_1010188 [Trametes meyenii]
MGQFFSCLKGIKADIHSSKTHRDMPFQQEQENSTKEPRAICDIPVRTLDTEKNVLDLSSIATPCHVRLVDCVALTERGVLRIVEFPEFPEFPDVRYSAISYPWRGVGVDEHFSSHIFAVLGATDADPVGSSALTHACAASILRGCPYLWLDRLCIMQNNKVDKRWQIRVMYNVYQSCRLCLVLAGGVRRLVRLDEETTWIHRSWTLQEVLAPPTVVVLLDWKLGSGTSMSGGTALAVEEVIAGESAIVPLSSVLEACTVGTLSFTPNLQPTNSSSPPSPKPLMVAASIFSALPTTHTYNDIPFWQPQRKLLAPNVTALTIAMDPTLVSDPDTRAHAVWQSALMRTSSRPVDMVFSIMGLFGVTLDPGAFDKDDRRGATIALAQAILSAGGSASWLGLGCRLEPDRTLSTFPTFPRTSVSGVALVENRGHVQEVSELVDPVYPVGEALVPFPKGSMDDMGYFSFAARAVRVRPVRYDFAPSVFEALDGSHWAVLEHRDQGSVEGHDSGKDTPETDLSAYAVLLGWFNRYYPGMTSATDTDNIRAMLVEEHRPGMFHVRSFFLLHRKERSYVLGWPESQFRVGGPDISPSSSSQEDASQEELVQDYSERDTPWPRVPNTTPVVTVEDEMIRKARWAVPQRALERLRSQKADHSSA